MKIHIQTMTNNAVIPAYGTDHSAGADLYALSDADTIIAPAETKLIHTGIAVAIPEGNVGLVYARSGLASKRGLAPANCVGVIDSDYRGEIMVALHNHSDKEQSVSTGERIAQLVIAPYIKAEFETVSELDDTERGSGGFGSTGNK